MFFEFKTVIIMNYKENMKWERNNMKKVVLAFCILTGVMSGCSNETKDKVDHSEHQQKQNAEAKVEKRAIIAVTKENGKEKFSKKEVEIEEMSAKKRGTEMKKVFEGKTNNGMKKAKGNDFEWMF